MEMNENTLGMETQDVQPNLEQSEQSLETSEQNVEPTQSDNTIEIGGKKYSLDEIQEWQKGYLRQSDYTRKTQQLAEQRKQYEKAIELYNYLQSKPHLVQKLAELENEIDNSALSNVTPQNNQELFDLNIRLKSLEIDKELQEITSKDKHADEVAILNLATEMGTDIKTAYYIWRGQNLDNILQQELNNYSLKVTNEIKNNQQKTKTLIQGTDKPADNFGLTELEMVYADKLGMSYEEYSKWKTR